MDLRKLFYHFRRITRLADSDLEVLDTEIGFTARCDKRRRAEFVREQ